MGTATGLNINTNLNSLTTNRCLGASNSKLSKSLERLSSGYKINVAADDPSGLQISEQLRSQQSGISRAIQNSQEASNVIGIAEGALIEINSVLTKMRQLAIHAANEGATSPDQIAADQAEIDSGVQTIDRIASTTKYSDQFLLNGSKSLIYSTTTTVNDTMDNALIDITNSRMDQVFNRGNGSALSVNFTGLNADSGDAAIGARQARRAVLECDKTLSGLNDSNGWVPDVADGYVTESQKFILTGNSGSRSFSFMDGTHLGTIVEAINGLKTSTGIGATLTFDSSVTGSQAELETIAANGTVGTAAGARAANEGAIYNLGGNGTAGVSSISVDTAGTSYNANALVTGMNLDADGRMYLKWMSETDYIAYKDSGMTMEVGRGSAGGVMTSSNNSGVSSAYLTINTTAGVEPGSTTVLQFGQQFEAVSAGSAKYSANGMNTTDMQPLEADFGLDMTSGASCFSGIRLQDNTSDDAKLYFRTEYTTDGTTTVSVYKDAKMLAESLVAQGKADTTGGAPYQVSCVAVDADGDGRDSGIYATLNFTKVPTEECNAQGTLEFNQLGMRVYSTEYGSDQYIRLQNLQGNLLGYYANSESDQLESVAIGETIQENGGDALISVNGQMVRTSGLVANISSQNYSGELTFNNGEIGKTTIAQVGQDVGALSTRGGALQAVAPKDGEDPMDPTSRGYLSWTTNSRHNTSENLSDFIGGMQYQLGEGESDIERTIYSIPSMAAANIGKVSINKEIYTLQDVLSGGSACLSNDPVAAMKIIAAAIDDVTSTRARLGAFQKDMLETNINSMEVTVENITKTESYIRDTDMATESTVYTTNQILVQAGTSMLAQANQLPQNVLSLLG